jgi:hypothetical protein
MSADLDESLQGSSVPLEGAKEVQHFETEARSWELMWTLNCRGALLAMQVYFVVLTGQLW